MPQLLQRDRAIKCGTIGVVGRRLMDAEYEPTSNSISACHKSHGFFRNIL